MKSKITSLLVEFQFADDLKVNNKPEQEYVEKLKTKGGEESEIMWQESKKLYVDSFIGEMNEKLSNNIKKDLKE